MYALSISIAQCIVIALIFGGYSVLYERRKKEKQAKREAKKLAKN